MNSPIRACPLTLRECRLTSLDLDRALRDRLIRLAAHQREDDGLLSALNGEIG